MAASASAVRAGKAFVELFADNTKLVAGLRAAKTKLKAFGEDVRSVGLKTFAAGAAGITAAAAAIKVFTEMGDSAVHAAARTGMTVEAFTALAYAARVCDVEQGAFEKGLIKMQRTMYAARTGVKSAAAAFRELKLDPKQLLGLHSEQQFAAIAEGLTRVQNPAMQNALAFKIFGTGCKALLPLLSGGAAGLAELAREAERLGLVISTKDAEAGHQLSLVFTRMWLTIKRVAFEIGAVLAPVFERAALWVLHAAVTTAKWIREQKPMVVLAFQIAAAITAVGAALIAVGATISFVGYALGALATICSVVASVWGGIVAVFGFMISNVGLVTAAVASLGAILLNVTGLGERAANYLRGVFLALAADAKATFGGIADALMAGDIALAVKVLWLAIKMEWIRGGNWLKEIWYAVSAALQKGFAALWYGAIATAVAAWNGIGNVVDTAVYYISGALLAMRDSIANVWDDVMARAEKAWNYVHGVWNRSFDVTAANKAVDESVAAGRQNREYGAAAGAYARNAELARNRKEREDALAAVGQESLGVGEQIDAEKARKIAEDDARLKDARQEWQDAIAQAKDAKAKADRGGFTEPKKTGLPDIGLPEREANAVRGGFSTMGGAMLGFAVANVQSRIAEASEQTAENTADILRELQDGGLEFSE